MNRAEMRRSEQLECGNALTERKSEISNPVWVADLENISSAGNIPVEDNNGRRTYLCPENKRPAGSFEPVEGDFKAWDSLEIPSDIDTHLLKKIEAEIRASIESYKSALSRAEEWEDNFPRFKDWLSENFPSRESQKYQGLTGRSCLDMYLCEKRYDVPSPIPKGLWNRFEKTFRRKPEYEIPDDIREYCRY